MEDSGAHDQTGIRPVQLIFSLQVQSDPVKEDLLHPSV